MKDKTDELVNHIFSFNESLTQATLTVQSETAMTFEEYKQILFDFVQDCDSSGKDLFNGDDGSTLLN